MLWSSHPQKPHCDAAGLEVNGADTHQVRRYSLLVWLGHVFLFQKQRERSGFDFTPALLVSNDPFQTRCIYDNLGSSSNDACAVSQEKGNKQRANQRILSVSFFVLGSYLSLSGTR